MVALSCSLLADLTAEAGFPPGVFNVVQGIGERAGAALTSDPGVTRISFTGSPETARAIGRAAASNLVPFTGELGGKGPLIVFADADLDDAAAKAARMYDDAGQVCSPAPGCWSTARCSTGSWSGSGRPLTRRCSVTRAIPRRRSRR